MPDPFRALLEGGRIVCGAPAPDRLPLINPLTGKPFGPDCRHCNRPSTHIGPHRRYDHDARVLGEWPVEG